MVSHREWLRTDELSNAVWTPKQIGDQLTACVFDLDNTLIDSDAKLKADVAGTFARLGLQVKPAQITGNWYVLAESLGIPRDVFDKEFNKRKTWEQSLADGEVSIFPETHSVLERLKARNLTLALLSKSIPEYTVQKLAHFDLRKYFSFMHTVHPKSPDKNQGAIEVVSWLNPGNFEIAYFIGDKEEDVACAQATSQYPYEYKINARGIYVNRQGKQLPNYPSVSSLEGVLTLI